MAAKKTLWLVLAFGVLLQYPACAARVTSDPNAPGAAKPAPAVEKPDKRLDQKITYQGRYKRLHEVTDDLAKQTGVTIRCGESSRDWAVRDVPVTICVKDVPLGKLLKLLAASCHVGLKSEFSEQSGEYVYRFLRSKIASQELQAYLEAKPKADAAMLNWAWDALIAAGERSGDPAVKDDLWLQPKLGICHVLSALGPNAKEKILGGGVMSVSIADPSSKISKAVGECDRPQRNPMENDTSLDPETRKKMAEFYEKQLEAAEKNPRRGIGARFFLTPGEGDSPGRLLMSALYAVGSDLYTTSQNFVDLSSYAKSFVNAKVAGIPPPPLLADAKAKVIDESPVAGLKLLANDDDWDTPLLKKKIRLVKPSNTGDVPFAAVASRISEDTGIGIIVEDFMSHRMSDRSINGESLYSGSASEALFGTEMEVGRALRSFEGLSWYLDQDTNTLIGRTTAWKQCHAGMLPKDHLSRITSLLHGDGLDLDDVISVWNLNDFQRGVWIDGSRDLDSLSRIGAGRSGKQAWACYSQLTAEQKTAASADAGLPLPALDPRLAQAMVGQFERIALSVPTDPKAPAEQALQAPPLSDLALRLQRMQSSTTKPGSTKARTGYCYTLELASSDKEDNYKSSLMFPEETLPLVAEDASAVLTEKAVHALDKPEGERQ